MINRLHLNNPPRARVARRLGWPLVVVAMGLLGACSSDEQELQSWLAEQRKAAKPNVSPLSEPKAFDPQPYMGANAVSPFSNQKMVVAGRGEIKEPNPLLTAEMNRRREPLEAFPLDSMSMVGTLNRNAKTFALLRVDNLLYQVKVGDYLGQNFGRITRIQDNEVALREVVQDATGEWIERVTTLQLQEKVSTQ
jgi:type IV pilus assembly protein PilP